MIYLTTFSTMLLLGVATRREGRLRTELYPILLVLLFIFAAFRWEVGCDWSGYLNQFLIQEGQDWRHALAMREPIWWGIIELQHRLGLPYPWLNVFSSAIFFFGFHQLARRQPDPLAFLITAFPILIINMPMTAMRQGAAIGIMCYSFAAFADRRTVAFTLATVLASMLHSSALIFMLLVPLAGGRLSAIRIFIAALLSVPGVFLLLDSSGADRAVSLYIEQELDSMGAIFRNFSLILTALMFFIFAARVWFRTYPDDFKLAIVGAIGMLFIAPLLPLSTVIADRFGYYLVPIQCMIFSRLPYLSTGRYRQVLSALPYVGLIALFGYWTLNSWHFNQCYVPYQSWIFGMPK